MNIVDSSGWLEYFANGPNAQRFLPALKDVASLLVPAVSIYEVFKVVLRENGENAAGAVVTNINRKLSAFGIRIRGNKHSGYRLIGFEP